MSSRKPTTLETIAMLPSLTHMWLLYKTKRYKELVYVFNRALRNTKQKRSAFEGYTPTEHDVFVCTYAKSGTYWTMQIALQIAHYGEAEFEHIHDVIPWPDVFMPTAIRLEDSKAQTQSPTGLRVIKTHLESEFVPYHPSAKYIVVVRDPKEAFVSSYFFAKALSPFGPMEFSVEDWMELFLANQLPYDSWAAHAASFWSWHQRPNVLYLRFDEMKRDHSGTCQRIAAFMGVKLTDAQLQKVLEKNSFQYMKDIDHKFTPSMPMVVRNQADSVMIRRGQSGGANELLSVEQQALIDRFCQAELRRLDSDFLYSEMFQLAVPAPELLAQYA